MSLALCGVVSALPVMRGARLCSDSTYVGVRVLDLVGFQNVRLLGNAYCDDIAYLRDGF
jgi:energy-converting hydrogenase Eha subunit B